MEDIEEESELLFFDTFSHEINDELNLDLVQFPKPVYITEVRIIPLGARVQADFPGGVRLGATNPSSFHIEFFVNDLAKPGASTFECLGNFNYNQNDCIHLQCHHNEDTGRQIPTDGLVLRGWYTTITLAVYGILTKNITEQIASPQTTAPQPPIPSMVPVQITTPNEHIIVQPQTEWGLPEVSTPVPTLETQYTHVQPELYVGGPYAEGYENPEYPPHEYYGTTDVPKDPRTFVGVEPDWNPTNVIEPPQSSTIHSAREVERDQSRDRDWDRVHRRSLSSNRSPKPDLSRSCDRTRGYSKSPSRDRDYNVRSKRDWSRSPEYWAHSRRIRDSSYERNGRRDPAFDMRTPEREEHRKRPRTPPMESPRRPRTPAISPTSEDELHYRNKQDSYLEKHAQVKFHEKFQPIRVIEHPAEERVKAQVMHSPTPTTGTPLESPAALDDDALSVGEQFEPILSDEDIADETEQFDIEFDFEGEYEDVLNIFNPFTTDLQRFEFKDKITHEIISTVNEQLALKEFENIIKFLQKVKNKSIPFNHSDFIKLSPDIKEGWIHTTEQFILQLNQFNQYNNINDNNNNIVKILLIEKNYDLFLIIIEWLLIGLDYDLTLSQQQPGYKIRHIKIGIRLIEILCCYKCIINYLLIKINYDIYEKLISLFNKKFMSLSIKLMIIKTINTTLNNKLTIDYFLNNNYYKIIINLLNNNNTLIRIKFALKSLIKKLHLHETLKQLNIIINNNLLIINNANLDDDNSIDSKINDKDLNLITTCLENIIKSYTHDKINFLQPKRFLPVLSKFELFSNISNNLIIKELSFIFIILFNVNNFLEILLIILSKKYLFNNVIINIIYDIFIELCNNIYGINYLIDNIDTTNLIVRCLLNNNNNETVSTAPVNLITNDYYGDNSRGQLLGIELAFKIQTKYHLDAITNTVKKQNDIDLDQLIDNLHSFYSLSCNINGKLHVVNTITMDNNIKILLTLIENEKKNELNHNRQLNQGLPVNVKCKSPILSYAIDLIDCVIRNCQQVDYMEEYGHLLIDLVKSHDLFEPSVSAILQEMSVYLKPIEITNVFSYDDITPLCDLLKRSMEYITTFPGDLITCLRILRHLSIPEYDDEIITENVELKYKFVILQFYSADGIQIIITIMEKLNQLFEQPGLQTHILVTTQGLLLTQILLPAIQLLRKMLSNVILCRNIKFKDMTAIEPLLHTYNLMHTMPQICAAYKDAQLIQTEIIKTLLSYTQPTPSEGVDTESVHKSLWTQLIGEIIKYIMNGPYTFIPGLLILSELLPLPLPVPTNKPLTCVEANRLITERQLWSAHLHPQNFFLSELIQTISTTSYPQLLLILSRVCLQLADLAPNMSLMVTKSIVELIINECTSSASTGATITVTPSTVTTTAITTTSQLVRLLQFLSSLVGYPSIKVSILSILHGKLLDVINSILITSGNNCATHLLAQEHVHTILQNLLDSEITMIAFTNKNNFNLELALACSIPSKEQLIIIINAIIDNFCIADTPTGHAAQTAVLRTMLILTEHDITMFILRDVLEKKKLNFIKIIKKIICDYKLNNGDLRPILNIMIEFLRSLVILDINTTNTSEHITPQRTIILTSEQFASILFWFKQHNILKNLLNENDSDVEIIATTSSEEQTEGNEEKLKKSEKKHFLKEFHDFLVKKLETTKNNDGDCFRSDNLVIIESLKIFFEILEKCKLNDDNEIINHDNLQMFEPQLPQAEGIVTQYASREIFKNFDGISERLSTNYWLNTLIYNDDDVEMEQIPCDLTEVIKTCLAAEVNIANDCKRLLHLSASPQSTRERTTAAPCFRTRRVEVEPSTGRPEKKIFITPMRGRGFPRTPPSRGDLFRSRPPNTSRPPSLHVDDFLALETCGAQPTGPTGYNKLAREIISIRGGRGGRGRGGFQSDRGRIPTVNSGGVASYRQTGSPSAWQHSHNSHIVGVDQSSLSPIQHFRTATSEPVVSGHFQSEQHTHQHQHPHTHYQSSPSHFGGAPHRARISRGSFSRITTRTFTRQM